MNFKAGDYVVLLSTCSCTNPNCWAPSIPINYCYQLSKDCNKGYFYIKKDMNDNSGNGWSCDTIPIPKELNNLEVRKATYEEEKEYIRYKKPFKIKELEKDLNQDYSYLISFIKQLET
jgi:hypothetical protein